MVQRYEIKQTISIKQTLCSQILSIDNTIKDVNIEQTITIEYECWHAHCSRGSISKYVWVKILK